jgi:quercetin dioxygenase-like cupin family protein
MTPLILAALATLAAGPVSTPIDTSTTTWSGQPYSVPSGPLQVTAQTVEMPVGGVLGVHKHPWPRFAYVQQGTLQVTNDDAHVTRDFKAGEFVVEAIGQWHHAKVIGDQPVKLLVIDQTPPGKVNLVSQGAE